MQKFSENLINSLIPYGNSNTVVEGIEELKVKVSDKQIGSLLKEIERRLPLIKNQVIDTRNFSRLPVNEYTVQTNVLHLDDAGYQLLESLLDLYKGKMCVGVQESLLDEALYLDTLKTLVSKRQDTYTVPIKSFADPQFKELLIVPPFAAQITDYCEAPRQVDGFSKDKLCMYAERRSALRPGSKVKVKVPNFLSKHSKNLTLHYYLESSTEVEEETYLDTFKLSADNSDERRSAVSAWVYGVRQAHPRMMLEEMAISKSRLRRDAITHNNPAFIVNCQKDGRSYKPTTLYVPPGAQRNTPNWRDDLQIPGGRQFAALLKEAMQGAGIYFTGEIKSGDEEPRPIFGTLSDLSGIDQLKNFVLSADPQSLNVWLCRFSPVEKQDVLRACKFAGADNECKKLFSATDGILFIENIRHMLGELRCTESHQELPDLFDFEQPQRLEIIIGADADQRRETRFNMEGQECSLSGTAMTATRGKILEISASGMKVKIDSEHINKFNDSCKLDCSFLGLSKVQYDIIGCNNIDGILRLSLHKSHFSETRALLNKFFESKKAYFVERSQAQRRRKLYAAMLDLTGRYLNRPCMLVTTGLETCERLESLMQPQLGTRYTISHLDDEHNINLSAILCDDTLNPETGEFDSVLTKNGGSLNRYFLFGNQSHIDSMFPGKVDMTAFEDKDERETFMNSLKGSGKMFRCWNANAVFCEQSEKYIKNLRLARLNRISKDAVFLVMSAIMNLSHIVYLNDLTALHKTLLSNGIFMRPRLG